MIIIVRGIILLLIYKTNYYKTTKTIIILMLLLYLQSCMHIHMSSKYTFTVSYQQLPNIARTGEVESLQLMS